jgi:hypothetical protein
MIEIPDWLNYMADDSRAQVRDVAELFGLTEYSIRMQSKSGHFPEPEIVKSGNRERGKPSKRIGWSKAVLLEEIARRNNA